MIAIEFIRNVFWLHYYHILHQDSYSLEY